MRIGTTTISCSAVALTLVLSVHAQAQTAAARTVKQTYSKDDKRPLALFPLTTAWTIALNGALAAAPAYHGSLGFFPIEGDRIVAYDLAAGTQRWIASIQTTLEPAVGDDLVFVATSKELSALRASDGALEWTVPFVDALAAPLAWDNGWLIAAAASGDVAAFRARDGALLWRHAAGSPATARPSLAADRVYIPTADARVVALRVDTGAVLWQRRFKGRPHDILAFDERLYVGSTDKNFYCLDTRNGLDLWRWPTGADSVGAPIADERNLYFVAVDNVLRALSRRTGVQQWKAGLSLRPAAGPAMASETLVVSGVAPVVRAFGAKDGKPAGEFAAPGELSAPIRVLQLPGQALPVAVIVTRELVKGATVVGLRRSVEPETSPMGPLPKVEKVVVPTLEALEPTPSNP